MDAFSASFCFKTLYPKVTNVYWLIYLQFCSFMCFTGTNFAKINTHKQWYLLLYPSIIVGVGFCLLHYLDQNSKLTACKILFVKNCHKRH